MMSLFAFQGAVELGLGYGLLAIGLYISYRIVNVADLTVDGSFTLGAAVSAVLTAAGHPVFGVLAAMVIGSLAGFAMAFLQTKMKIQPILAGILTMTALYSVNLRIMGKPNVPLLGADTIFTMMASVVGDKFSKLLTCLLIVLIIMAAVVLFFRTQLGLSIRATGDNEDMVRSSSINSDMTKTIGLCMANAIVALSGAVIAQMQMFADSSMGIGMVVIGLASIIIGEVIFGHSSVLRSVIAVTLGSVIYRIIIAEVLELGMPQGDLKLISSVIVALAISYPVLISHLRMRTLRKGNDRKGEKSRA